MAEELKKYFQFYNEPNDYTSRPLKLKNLISQIEKEINLLPEDSHIIFNINPVLLTERQYKEKLYPRDN